MGFQRLAGVEATEGRRQLRDQRLHHREGRHEDKGMQGGRSRDRDLLHVSQASLMFFPEDAERYGTAVDLWCVGKTLAVVLQ